MLPGDETSAFNDPVVLAGDPWRMWVCRHPLDVVGAEDRMSTWYATSADGLTWQLHGDVLSGRAGRWDARGARITAGLDPDGCVLIVGSECRVLTVCPPGAWS